MTRTGAACRVQAWMAAGLVMMAAGCQSVQTTSAGAVGIDRKQNMSALVSEADLRKGSEQAYTQLIGQARQKGLLNADAQITQRAHQLETGSTVLHERCTTRAERTAGAQHFGLDGAGLIG